MFSQQQDRASIFKAINITGSGARIMTLALALIAIPFLTELQAQETDTGPIEIVPGGSLWIEGSASVVDYRCYAEELSGNGTIKNPEEPQKSVKEEGKGDVNITVTIPVKSLDCGKKPMNRDMYEAMKADRHPNITFELLEASLVESYKDKIDSTNWMKINAKGLLTIAGETDTAEVAIDGQLLGDNRFRVKGAKILNMYDFEIKPPKALLGLIKADEKLTVHFDVTVSLKDNIYQKR